MHVLHNIKIKGEIGSGDQKAAKEFPLKLKKIIADGAYSPDKGLNAGETVLFLKKNAEKNICDQIATECWWF